MKFPRNARMLRSQLDAAPFAAVFFLLVIFMMLGSLVYTPGARLELAASPRQMACRARTSRRSRWPLMPTGGSTTRTSGSRRTPCAAGCRRRRRSHAEPLTLVVQADKSVSYERCMRLALLAREAGIPEALLATLPRAAARLIPRHDRRAG